MATRYVDATAVGANNGLTEADAWDDLNSGMSVAQGTLVLIKNGTYHRGQGPGSSQIPAFIPANSGTEAERIEFRNFPGHQPVLDCDDTESVDFNPNPVWGPNSGKDYTTWRGLRTTDDGTSKATAINAASHTIFEYCVITPGPRSGGAGGGNYYCVQGDTNPIAAPEIGNIVRYCTMRDAYTTGSPSDQNSGGYLSFSFNQSQVYQNTITQCGTCIESKEGDRDSSYTYNHCRPVAVGIMVVSLQNHCAAWDCSVQRISIHHNLILGGDVGLHLKPTPSGARVTEDFDFYNNTVWNALRPFRGVFPNEGVRIFNNIFVCASGGSGHAQTWGQTAPDNHPPLDGLIDFNFYFRIGGGTVSFNASETAGAAVESYATWRSTGASNHEGVAYDTNSPLSTTSDPLFVSTSDLGAPHGWKLQDESTAIGAGRTNGLLAGDAVNMGCYESAGQTEQIGVPPESGPRIRWMRS